MSGCFDFPVDPKGKRGWYVMSDDYVTLTDGTGVVHNAPAFGEDDARVGREWDLPFIQLVDAKGHMCGGTPWDGMYVKDADHGHTQRSRRARPIIQGHAL